MASIQAERPQVLLTCMGTSDPVRSGRDGPLLHILRHYRPERVYIFLSAEMEAYDLADGRIEVMSRHIRETWDGYAPEFIPVRSGLQEVHDIDALDKPLYDLALRVQREQPDSEILVNLTSGTPQMQMILSHLALDTRFRTRGIQVANPIAASGKTGRTNEKSYDPETELYCNEDEADGENRCQEPALYAVHRQQALGEIRGYLDRHEYAAIRGLSPELMRLVRHLDARSRLEDERARELAQDIRIGFSLYPIRSGNPNPWDYKEVSEYFLMLQNLQKKGQLTEFVLRLMPLVQRLQIAVIKRVLYERYNTRLSIAMCDGMEQSPRLSEEKLTRELPELKAFLEEVFVEVRYGTFNIVLGNRILQFFGEIAPELTELFARYESLNGAERNSAAHELHNITEESIRKQCEWSSEQLVKALREAIPAIYPECDRKIFNIYYECERYIRDNM